MVVVDSSIWIEAARRQGDISCKVALEALLEEYEAVLCSPVRLEVLGGARKEERSRLLEDFAVVPYWPIEESVWELALNNAWKLRDGGHTIPWNDILVASLALQKGCRVFARDQHFEVMSTMLGLRLYSAGNGGSYVPDAKS